MGTATSRSPSLFDSAPDDNASRTLAGAYKDAVRRERDNLESAIPSRTTTLRDCCRDKGSTSLAGPGGRCA
jgi:hypothetical protein